MIITECSSVVDLSRVKITIEAGQEPILQLSHTEVKNLPCWDVLKQLSAYQLWSPQRGQAWRKNSPQGSIKYHTVKNEFRWANKTATACWTNNSFGLVLSKLLKTSNNHYSSCAEINILMMWNNLTDKRKMILIIAMCWFLSWIRTTLGKHSVLVGEMCYWCFDGSKAQIAPASPLAQSQVENLSTVNFVSWKSHAILGNLDSTNLWYCLSNVLLEQFPDNVWTLRN